MFSIDPFANKCKIAKVTNDINPAFGTDYNLDALDFLMLFLPLQVDFVLYDPPYSPRQVKECYQGFGKEVTKIDTQFGHRKKHMVQIDRILKNDGFIMTCGWNSNGIGLKGYEVKEILLLRHGGSRNDTIVMIEQKRKLF